MLLLVALVSCTGSLSDEQRKRIKESMEQGEIKKFSEAQITEAAIQYGDSVMAALKSDDVVTQKILWDSVFNVEIILLKEDNPNLRDIERQILGAYVHGGGSEENIQKMGPDSLLYTMPYLRDLGDGTSVFEYAIGIRMTRKQVVLSIKD